VTPDELKATCLALPGAAETFPFGDELSVFKVAGKIFAIVPIAADRVSLKCEPELAEQLRLDYAAIRPGYHLNKRHWNTVTLDGSVPDRMLREMIEDSYDLIVASLPGAKRAALADLDRR
jgi:predicted DNA-binding protein (MmcQ/YjbR family)